MKKLLKIIQSIYLCIRFPFLYPRNRFTGLHYNNWKIIDKITKLYNEAYTTGTEETGFKAIKINILKAIEYKILSWFHNWFLQIIFCIPTYTELGCMESGWRKAFGIQMCKEIKEALLQEGGYPALYKYRIVQIKEKYGQLRWYDSGSTDTIQKIIQKYEYISFRTCIVCGNLADGTSGGYILPYCNKCYKYHDYNPLTPFYTEDNTWYGYTKI